MEGGENIKQADWLSVSNIIQLVSCGRAALLACEHGCTQGGTHKGALTPSCRTRLQWQWVLGMRALGTPLQGLTLSVQPRECGEERTLWKRCATASEWPLPGLALLSL